MTISSAPGIETTEPGHPSHGRLRGMLDRRTEWAEALLMLTTVAVAFVVLGFLARYFQDYSRLILIFFFAWLLAFMISPTVDWLQRRLTRLPRGIAVVAVILPVILVCAIVIARVVASLEESFVELAAAQPGLVANPPAILTDIQAWFDARGIAVDVVATFQSIVENLLTGLVDVGIGLFGGLTSVLGTLVDSIVVVSLATYMAVDRDKILRFGLGVTPPEKRDDVLLFRRNVGSATAGFLRSQLIIGGLYGIWAFVVSAAFGLPFGPATAFLAGVIMAIPIYGPYVSWLPPVVVAALVRPEIAVVVAAVMLVGWFIDENILAPLVRADALELHPIVVTFAFLLGAQLAGAIGAIVAIPLAAVVQAFVMRYLEDYRTTRGWPPPDEGQSLQSAPPAPSAVASETPSA